MAVDPNGNAVALWVARPPADQGNENVFNSIWAASRTPAGQWSQPFEISVASAARGYELVIDDAGTATAVWYSMNEEEDAESGYFLRSSSRPLGGSWSSPVDISGPSLGEPQFDLAANADGDVTAVWRLSEGRIVIEEGEEVLRGFPVLQAARRPAGGDWGTEPEYLTDDEGGFGAPVVSVDADGNATAAWPYSDEGDIGVRTTYRDATSDEWSAPTMLWDDVFDLVQPGVALAAGPEGETIALWSSFGPGGHVMRASARVAGGAWDEPVILSGPDGGDNRTAATNPQILADAQGNLTAAWTAAVGPSPPQNPPGYPIPIEYRRLQSAYLPAGGEWGDPIWLSGPDDLWAVDIAVDPEGYVTAIWDGLTAVRSRVFDPLAPDLGNVTVPSTGVVGKPIAMSVDPRDVWSAVATGWDFGDGGSAVGAAVSYCYSTPGDYTVTITGSDLAANAASATRTIEIEADPDAGPDGDESDPCAAPDPGSGPGSGTDPDPDPGSGRDPGPGTKPGPGPDKGPGGGPASVSPTVTGLRQSRSRWRLRTRDHTRQLARGSRPRPPVGTVFRFRLNRPARVKLRFSRLSQGGKAKPQGALRATGVAGANAFAFNGKIHGHKLTPGRYRLTVTARAAGKTSPGASISFTIVR